MHPKLTVSVRSRALFLIKKKQRILGVVPIGIHADQAPIHASVVFIAYTTAGRSGPLRW